MARPEALIGGLAGAEGGAGAGPAAAAGRGAASGVAAGADAFAGGAAGAGVDGFGATGARGAAGAGAAAAGMAGAGLVRGRGAAGGGRDVTSLAGRLVMRWRDRSGRAGAGAGAGVAATDSEGGPTMSAGSLEAFAALAAGFSSASSGWAARRRPSRSALRRTRSAWASSMEEEWLLTPMPSDTHRSSASLFVRPSSRASS
jgi:hypothetical protein